MSTSIHKGKVGFNVNHIDPNEPLDAESARILINNTLHWGDVAGQVLVAFATVSGVNLTTVTSTADEWARIATFGPFHLRINADGTPFPVRVRIAGKAAAALPVEFGLVLGSNSSIRNELSELLAGGSNTTTASTSSTTSAWLTAGSTLLTLTAEQVMGMTEHIHTVDAIGGGATSVIVVHARLSVWGRYTSSKTDPQLTGLYAAEYVGL